jgi:hypothetical protein
MLSRGEGMHRAVCSGRAGTLPERRRQVAIAGLRCLLGRGPVGRRSWCECWRRAAAAHLHGRNAARGRVQRSHVISVRAIPRPSPSPPPVSSCHAEGEGACCTRACPAKELAEHDPCLPRYSCRSARLTTLRLFPQEQQQAWGAVNGPPLPLHHAAAPSYLSPQAPTVQPQPFYASPQQQQAPLPARHGVEEPRHAAHLPHSAQHYYHYAPQPPQPPQQGGWGGGGPGQGSYINYILEQQQQRIASFQPAAGSGELYGDGGPNLQSGAPGGWGGAPPTRPAPSSAAGAAGATAAQPSGVRAGAAVAHGYVDQILEQYRPRGAAAQVGWRRLWVGVLG